jgi:hypothetical protein
LKQGPKTQLGSRHENENIDNEEEPPREDILTSLVKANITGDIEDINKDGFSQKAASATGQTQSDLRLHR